jgi:hypothetical protein
MGDFNATGKDSIASTEAEGRCGGLDGINYEPGARCKHPQNLFVVGIIDVAADFFQLPLPSSKGNCRILMHLYRRPTASNETLQWDVEGDC